MARLWTCGFELQSAAAGVEFSVVNGTPTISTTVHRAGAASLRSNPTAGTQYAEHQLDPGTVKRTLHRLYLRIGALPSADCNVYGIGQSGYFPGLLRLTTTGALTLRDGFTSANLGAPTAPLAVGRWYRVELDYTDVAGIAGSVTGAFKGYLDGVLFADTLCSNINGWSRIRAGVQSAATADIYIDDIAVNDTTGTVQNGLPGPGSVVHLRPDSAGDAAGWTTTVGGTANWDRVSETTPDDATTYNSTAAAGTTAIDDFNLASTASAGIGSGDTITLVQVGGRIGSTAATAASLVYRIKGQAGGTTTESASVSVALNGWATHKAAAPYPYQLTAYTNPQSGAAWTPAALDGAQIGYRANVSQTTVRRVSTLWALVEFQPLTTTALGTASETGTAQALAGLAGVPIGTLADDFNDGVVDPVKWPDSYEGGGFSEVGGRARVACNVAYNAFASDAAYRLRESSAHVRMWPPAAGGAVAEAWAQMLIQTITLGTDAIFEVSAVTGNLIMASRVGYFDPDQVTIPYDPATHAWLRIRETGGQLLWDTSPDGITWTNRRTATSPAWVGDTTLQVQLIAHRDGGTDDYAEFDSFNVVPGSGTEAALTPAAEAVTAQALAGRKTQALGIASETTAAQPPGRARARALPTATETSAGHPLPGTKRLLLTTTSSTTAALPLAGAKHGSTGLAETVETARPLTGGKRAVVGPAAEADAGQTAGRRKTGAVVPGTAVETARPAAGAKRLALAPATETDSARPLTGSKRRPLGAAVSVTTARPLDVVAGLLPTEETSTALTLGRSKTTVQGTAGEVDEARPLGRAKRMMLGRAAEASSTGPLAGGLYQGLAPAEDTSRALDLGRASTQALPTAAETAEAATLTGGAATALDRAQETTSSGPVTGRKTQALPTSVEGGAAQSVTGHKTLSLGLAVEASTALAAGGVKRQALPIAEEIVQAQQLLIPGRVDPAEERVAARPFERHKVLAGALAQETTAAQPVAGLKRYALTAAVVSCAARPLGSRKAAVLAAAVAVEEAGQLAGTASRQLGTATEMDRALIGPKIRLTWAATRDEARPLAGQRQRPADHLDATTSGPVLTPSTAGPSLTASSSGPRLAATTTSGG